MNIQDLQARTDVPVVVVNDDGTVINVNTCFEQVLGWSQAEIEGQRITLIIPSAFRDSHNLSFARYFITEKSEILNHPIKLKAVTKSNEEIEMEHFITAERHGETWQFAAILRPL